MGLISGMLSRPDTLSLCVSAGKLLRLLNGWIWGVRTPTRGLEFGRVVLYAGAVKAAVVVAPGSRFMKIWLARFVALSAMALLLPTCSDDKTDADEDAGGGVDDGGGDDGGDVAAVDANLPQGTLQWRRFEPPDPVKMRAIAAVPGQAGQYVIVGDEAHVWRFAGGSFTQLQPTGIAEADLHAVWVTEDGRIVVGGEANSLLIFDGDIWQPAPVNPAQPVTFRAISGGGGQIWAVGDGRSAWRHDGTTWLAETVTVTADDGAAIGGAASFVGVAVDSAGDAWIAANQGADSASVVAHQDGKTWLGAALSETASDIWLAAGADKDAKGRVFAAGGLNDPLVAIWDGAGFAAVSSDNLNWKLGFSQLAGLDADRVWVAGLKGQLRRRDGTTWQVVNVASAPGVTPSFSASKDLVDIAVQGEEDLVVLSAFTVYRYGIQP